MALTSFSYFTISYNKTCSRLRPSPGKLHVFELVYCQCNLGFNFFWNYNKFIHIYSTASCLMCTCCTCLLFSSRCPRLQDVVPRFRIFNKLVIPLLQTLSPSAICPRVVLGREGHQLFNFFSQLTENHLAIARSSCPHPKYKFLEKLKKLTFQTYLRQV